MQGVVASGIAFAVQIWCIDRGGPVFVAVYQPVQTLVVAIMASVALGEEFYLGGSAPFPSLIYYYYYYFINQSQPTNCACMHLHISIIHADKPTCTYSRPLIFD